MNSTELEQYVINLKATIAEYEQSNIFLDKGLILNSANDQLNNLLKIVK